VEVNPANILLTVGLGILSFLEISPDLLPGLSERSTRIDFSFGESCDSAPSVSSFVRNSD